MNVEIARDPESAAVRAADWLAAAIAADVRERGKCVIALSGGQTPWQMLAQLVTRPISWPATHVAQVDERIVAADDPRRNLSRIESILVTRGALARDHLHAMPVEASDLAHAAGEYQRALESLCGVPATLDVVQLGLGTDGHTASLFPGDAALDVSDRDVAVTQAREGRMTLTMPAINRARRIVWIVTGDSKRGRLRELLAGSGEIPASRVARAQARIFADAAAAG